MATDNHEGILPSHAHSTSIHSKLPLEIWLQIFEIACTDDGATSLSLSLTSRDFREWSRSHRYRSVTIEGWESLLKFEEVHCSSSNLDRSIVGDGNSVRRGGGVYPRASNDSEAEKVGQAATSGLEVDTERTDVDVEEGENAKRTINTKESKGKGRGDSNEDDGLKGSSPTSGIVNLYVYIPELYNAAYPPESWLSDTGSDEDSSYVPSDNEDAKPEGKDANHDNLVKDNLASDSAHLAESDQTDDAETLSTTSSNDSDLEEERLLEYASGTSTPDPSDESESEDALSQRYPLPVAPNSELSLLLPYLHGQTLDYLLHGIATPLSALEHKVFSALQRILLLSSSSLEVFALCFQPCSNFYLEAFMPRLEKLRWLTVFKDGIGEPSQNTSPGMFPYAQTHMRFKLRPTRCEEMSKARGCLWPNLEYLNINSRDNHLAFDNGPLAIGADPEEKHYAWRKSSFDGLLDGASKLKVLYAPRYLVRSLSPLPNSIHSVHAYLGYPGIPSPQITGPTVPVSLPGGGTLSLPVLQSGVPTNSLAATGNIQSGSESGGTGGSEEGEEGNSNVNADKLEADMNFALTETEVTDLLYPWFDQTELQAKRSTSATYYRVPEPGESGLCTSMRRGSVEKEGDTSRSGEGVGDEKKRENEANSDSGRKKERGKAKSTNELAWVKEEWVRATEQGWW